MAPPDPITEQLRVVNALRYLDRFAEAANRAMDTGKVDLLRDVLDTYERSDTARFVLETLFPAEHAA